jgi:hypothetical protein
MRPAVALVAAMLLGAAAPPPAVAPPAAPAAPAPPSPEQWGIITNLPGGSCGAKSPSVGGIDFDIALSPSNIISMVVGNAGWKIEPRTYDVLIRLDDFEPFAFSMVGRGPALIGEIPPDFRAEFLTAGKVGFRFNQTDYTIAVRNLSGVVARLETCVDAKRAAKPGK